jgi:predicted AlkP superfamily phosphohydrolase/phosphomutase
MPLRRPHRKAVLIGLDAAMLEYWDRYVAEGRCPNLARLLREGASAEACSAPPPATAVNWNAIATGRRAAAPGEAVVHRAGRGHHAVLAGVVAVVGGDGHRRALPQHPPRAVVGE